MFSDSRYPQLGVLAFEHNPLAFRVIGPCLPDQVLQPRTNILSSSRRSGNGVSIPGTDGTEQVGVGMYMGSDRITGRKAEERTDIDPGTER